MREKHKKHKDYSRCNSRYVVIKSGFNVLKTVVSKLSAAVPPLLLSAAFAAALCGCSSPFEATVQTPGPITDYIRASEPVLENDSDNAPATSGETAPAGASNPYPDLSVPTWLTKVEDTYFLVDCYHNQVIYHDNLEDPLSSWKVMTGDIDKGHTLASDGEVYLIDDTEQNRVLIFEKQADAYVQVSVRSFTIIGDEIYFVSGNASIIRADLDTFEILETYPVPDQMAGMIQLTRIQDYFYITVSTDITGNQDHATILRTRNLSALAEGGYEDIYENFIGGGTPYYITQLDNAYYLTEHRLPGHSLWRFCVEDNQITEVEAVY